MDIKTLTEVAHSAAKEKGFWDSERNKPELLMLIVSEAAEALEALRKDKYSNPAIVDDLYEGDYSLEEYKSKFEESVKNTFEDEIADTVIRLFDLAGGLNIDLEKHILLKLQYNATRGYKHGKTF